MAEPSVRILRDDERAAASRVVNLGMLGPVHDEVSEGWAELIEANRSHGAFTAAEELVGLARFFPTVLSVPGGEVPAAGVTAVAVVSTHRRQGHLTRLMHAQLQAIADEQIPVALLVAAEWPIYGRYGYGPAIDACRYEIDAATARFVSPPSGAVELVTPAELRPHLEAVHEARRVRTAGAIRREAMVWDRIAGVAVWPGQTLDPGPQRGALWRDDTGAVQGAVAYKVDDAWVRNRPAGRAEVGLLVGATPTAERELWRHLCEIDWVQRVSAGNRGVDDPLPFFVDDGRSTTSHDHFDCIWARILDVPGTIGARRSLTAGTVVIDVADPLGFATGRWRIELAPDGAEVAPTTATPDVSLPVAALGALFLGGRSARRLHEAGWIDETLPGGVERLDAALRTAEAPWSPTTY
ncbi:MAG: GNAT family N-acetyltransferase [Acidimicrobiales bacterium]